MCSIFGVTAWQLLLNGYAYHTLVNDLVISSRALHAHEMLFGFGATVAVGFILTAAQTWTNLPGLKGAPVAGLVVIWLAVRVCLYLGGEPLFITAIIAQAVWWLSAIAVFSRMVIKARNKRNYLFVPVLSILMLLNLSLLFFELINRTDLTMHLARTSVLMFCVLMGIVGGRVIPFFTSSGTRISVVSSSKPLSVLVLVASLLGATAFFLAFFVQLPFSPAVLMVLSGLLHLARLAFWRTTSTFNIPLLWSLHLSYAAMGLGLIALGSSYFVTKLAFVDALHLITIGAMGLMIFAMMSRVSLGHTGRALVTSKLINWSFLAIFVSALVRASLPLFDMHTYGWNLSSWLWVGAGAAFLWVYIPILSSPKRNRPY